MWYRAICAVGVVLFLAGGVIAAEPDANHNDEELRGQLEAAQERLRDAAREVSQLSRQLSQAAGPFVAQVRGALERRAVLGINIDGDSDDAGGVKVVGVNPDGPAARAGVRTGDLLTRIDDVPLEGEQQHSARAKLLDHLRDIEPGQTVKLEYLRGGRKNTVEVTTEAARFGFARPGAFGAPGVLFGHNAGAFAGIQLAPITRQLGQYFGTEEGLLIVRAPRDARLKLEDGDVLLDIDGRKPASSSHAMRILGSYQVGEKVKLNVLRRKQRMTLEVPVPEQSGSAEPLRGHMHPPAPEPPAPPEPPL